MIDFTPIGQAAFVIQYEDLISLIGLNTTRYIRSKQELPNTDELTLEYLNRTEYDMEKFVQTHNCTMLNIPYDAMMKSPIACKPNLAYAFKMIQAAHTNGIQKFVIHSNEYSPVIENIVKGLEIRTTYVHGDIVPVLRSLPNCTYTTSNPDNIRKCMDVQVPFALTIVDDFQYVAPIVFDQPFIDKLRAQNVFVQFTGVISAGII